MLEVISGLPREELFSATEERLHETAVGVLAVADRRAVRLFLRPDPFRRFISCLVYLPRDQYTTSSRLAMADLLQRRLGGSSVEYTARVSESRLALVHFTVQTDRRRRRLRRDGRRGPAGRAHRGRPHLGRPAALRAGRGRARRAARRAYRRRTRPSHRPRGRWRTSRRIAALAGPVDFSVRLCPADSPADRRFTLYLASTPATLTDVLPLLQQLGLDVLDERPSEFDRADGLRVHVYDFSIRLDDATRTALDARPEADIEREFCAAFGAAWRGDVETDRFSALVLRAGLPWREVAVLRAYARYARQIGAPYGLALHGGHPARAPGRRARAAGALPGPVRPGAASTATRRSRPPSPTCAPGSTPSPAWTPTASCAASSR